MKTPISLTHTEQPHHEAGTPTNMLRHEHEVILRALALLERMGQGLEGGRPVDRKALGWLRDFFGTFADKCHHGKEEQHLFPAMERHGVPREGGPLGVMLQEHEEGRARVRAMGHDDDRQVAEAIRGYTTLLRAHIDKENEVLFPLAEELPVPASTSGSSPSWPSSKQADPVRAASLLWRISPARPGGAFVFARSRLP